MGDDLATPFTRHAFLDAMERSGCAAPDSGWTPRHLTLWRGERMVAAAPAYVKDDSDGDFARDWDLAGAAERGGLHYYPKLAVTVPFTPVTGRRLLVAAGEDRRAAVTALLRGARELCKAEGYPTLQILFPHEDEARQLATEGITTRVSFQYHWHNAGYRSIEDFLARFSSKRRNALRREIGTPIEQGIVIRTVRDAELASRAHELASTMHDLHRTTVDKMMWGRRWLNRDLYERLFATMPDALEVVEARRGDRLIAGAFNVASSRRLYGRYWGCFEEHPFLHFNVCYYHSIAECIDRGTEAFEGGAGGDHKIARGFEPTPTWSAHWFADLELDRAVRDYLDKETRERLAAVEAWRSKKSPLRTIVRSATG